MHRRVLAIVLGLVVLTAGLALWYGSSRRVPASERSRPSPVAAPPGPRAEPPPTVATLPDPAPERGSSTSTRAPRRAAAPNDAVAATEPVAPSAMGTLRFTSDVTGAQVFIDRNYIGVTPVTSPEIALGPHRVNIVAPGYESIAENLDVEAGSRDLQFNFKDVRLDAAVDVVHKHRIGSCNGRLVATPQGLRYETDDKDDRFAFALTDLETFEVDYLAKTLKVKGVKGKRFEFSDPAAANGDRLFVFHRDVDKARQKLKQGS